MTWLTPGKLDSPSKRRNNIPVVQYSRLVFEDYRNKLNQPTVHKEKYSNISKNSIHNFHHQKLTCKKHRVNFRNSIQSLYQTSLLIIYGWNNIIFLQVISRFFSLFNFYRQKFLYLSNNDLELNELVRVTWPLQDNSRFPLRIRVAGEYCKVTGGLLWKGKALSGNKQNLARELCVVAGEFSDLRCLMNTLWLHTADIELEQFPNDCQKLLCDCNCYA